MEPLVVQGISFYNFNKGDPLPFHDWVFKTHRYESGLPPPPVIAERKICYAKERTDVYIENFSAYCRGSTAFEIDNPVELAGEYHFGGYFNAHFAHFLLDTVSTLWTDHIYNTEIKILFFAEWNVLNRQYVRYVLDLLGLSERIHIEKRPVRVEKLHLTIPIYSSDYKGIAYTSNRDFLGRARENVADSPTLSEQPVYLSRRKASVKRRYDGEYLLEQILSREGFLIVHPDELTMSEHVQLLNSHLNIVSPCGAACYPLFFSRIANSLYVLDANITPSFLYLKNKAKLNMSLIFCCTYYGDKSHYLGNRVFDLSAALYYLKHLGLVNNDIISSQDWDDFRAEVSEMEYDRTRNAYGRLLHP